VGARLNIPLIALDPNADDNQNLKFGFSCPTLKQINTRYRMDQMAGNEAVFSWTPIGMDVGEHTVEYSVSDGDLLDVEVSMITVKPGTGSSTAPVFRKPEGDGATLDLEIIPCALLEILVEDPDTLEVEIRQDPPIPGSTLKLLGPTSGVFEWCPSQVQIDTKSLFVLRLVADDKDNPPVRKNYTILLREELPNNCPGAPPHIVHTPPPSPQTGDSVTIEATVTDDKGLKEGSPVVYITDTKPPDPSKLNYAEMIQLDMTQGSGPNHYKVTLDTEKIPPGTPETVYYIIEAEDNDDPAGKCDHRSRHPIDNMFQFTVNKPMPPPCTSGSQCIPGQVCDGSNCVKDDCAPYDDNSDGLYHEQNSCPTGHFCPAKGPDIGPSHCAQECGLDPCTVPGTTCKAFDTKKGCGQQGNKVVGRECTDFTECQGMAMCLDWPGGYCAISDCSSGGSLSGQCPQGSACIPVPDQRFGTTQKHWICLQLCADATNCRSSDGYSCLTKNDDEDNPQQVCYYEKP
jgi:hypothetical protein